MGTKSIQLDTIQALISERQNDICDALSVSGDTAFKTDIWQRNGGGGGNTRVVAGAVLERAGVNTSYVHGEITPSEAPMFQQLLQKVAPTAKLKSNATFEATGLSLVIHPKNPFVPTVHANYRYFELDNNNEKIWWIGGGADLTPYYLFDEDATHFHTVHKQVCDRYKPNAYQPFKQQCDEYFYIPHRRETRGIGGIFFDYLNDDFDQLFEFISNASNAFIDAYIPILEKRKNTPYTDTHRQWQSIRRGRYAEFNLVYDRGTLFGLKTDGRIESILMSMPPMAEWRYDHTPEESSEEAKIQAVLKQPKDWV
jgi:coproporphyrinogen III oxidase